MTVRLPKPFIQILESSYRIRGYNIMEAYLDKTEHKNSIYNNITDLRGYLNLTDNDSVCDCYCIVNINNLGKKGFLFEDKNTKHMRDIFNARIQLQKTCKNLLEKGKNVDYAILCNIQLESSFKCGKKGELPAKPLFHVQNNKQIFIEGIINLGGQRVPLLYYKE